MPDSIEAFLAAWSESERAGDIRRIDAMLTDDFVAVGPLGFVLPKQAWLDRHRPGGLSYDSFALTEVQARVHGTAAVVTARNDTDGSYQDHALPEASRATLVLVRDNATWRIAAAHMSFLAGTRGAPPLPGSDRRPGESG